MAKPPHFSGVAADLPDWLEQFTNYAEILRLPKHTWTGCAITFMPSDVRPYMRQRTTDSRMPSFPDFTRLLHRKYCGVDPITHYVQLVQEARQLQTETIAAYGSRFSRLIQLANQTKTVITTTTAIVNFINGIRNESIQQYLTRKRNAATQEADAGRTPKLHTLQHYVDAACNCDVRPSSTSAPSAGAAGAPRPPSKPKSDSSGSQHSDAPIAAVAVKPLTTADPAVVALHDELKKLIAKLSASTAPPPAAPQMHSNTAPGGNRSRLASAVCFNCHKRGHIYRQCPEPIDETRVAAKVAEVEAAIARRDAAAQASPVTATGQAAAPDQPPGK